MEVETTEYDSIGYVAAVFLCAILIPQLYHNYKLKETSQISWYFVILSIITAILFLSYGILLGALPMIIANIIVLLQNIFLFILKKKYDK